MDKNTYSLLKLSQKDNREEWGEQAYILNIDAGIPKDAEIGDGSRYYSYYIDPQDPQAFNSEEEVYQYRNLLMKEFNSSNFE